MNTQRHFHILALTVAISGFACEARADSNFDRLLDMSLEDLMQVKITSSTLSNESLKSVPSSMTVFTREQIHELGVNTLEELMNHVPGYQSYRSDQSSAAYSSRSRRMSALSREILILLDGQRLNHDLFGNASDIETNLALDNVARVEFLRGPGSALYGANAFLGVVNIITSKQLNDASISTGNHQQQRAAANFSKTFSNGLQSSFSAQGTSSKGEQQALYSASDNRFIDSRQQFSGKSAYWQASWNDWSLQARHSEQFTDDGYSTGNVDNGYNQFTARSSFLALTYQQALNENWELHSRLYDTPYSIQQRWHPGATLRARAPAEGRETGFENRLSWHRDDASALLGFDYSRNVIASSALTLWAPPAPPFPAMDAIDDGGRKVSATYAQWQDTFFKDFSYILGVRKDQYSDVDGHTSPRMGLIWQLDDANSLKWLYGEAFRAPARNELGIKVPGFTGNPDLKPEISKTAEMIWIREHKQFYSSISLFDTEIDDAVIRVNATPNYINQGQQHFSGTEVEWQWFFENGWQLRGDLSHIFNSPFAINADAENRLGASLIYSQQQLTASLSGRYHGDSRDADNSARGYHALGGYTLFDTHVHYQLTPDWQVFANFRNLTDKQYTLPALQEPKNLYGVPSTGREVEVGVRWNF